MKWACLFQVLTKSDGLQGSSIRVMMVSEVLKGNPVKVGDGPAAVIGDEGRNTATDNQGLSGRRGW